MINKIPKTENGPTVTINEKYLVTMNKDKLKFTLWSIEPNGYEKIAVADSPFTLYDKIKKINKKG